MKTTHFLILSFFLSLFVFCCTPVHAQIYRTPKYTQLKKAPNIHIKKPVLLKPDLIVVDQINNYRQNGRRYVAVRVKNIGNVQTATHRVELRTSWRIDYEHWTTVERFTNFRVPGLAPNAQFTIRYCIPDHEIHTNEGFGSNSVSLRFFTDRPNQISELSESNNIRTFYVPVLRD